MDWQRHRAPIMGVITLALVGVTWWAFTSRTGDSPVEAGEESASANTLPEIERDDVSEIEVRIPADEDDEASEPETVRLVRGEEDTWRLAEPMDAEAASTAVSTALDKLTELEVVGRAASRAQHHEQLEVDEAHGIRVIARQGTDTLVDLWIGAYRAGNTMVRVEGQDAVLMVQGSIKFAFNKSSSEWRNRAVLELTAADIHTVEFTNENGHWTFAKNDEDAWEQQLSEPDEGEAEAVAIEDFDAARVGTIVSSLARMRASDFSDGSPEETGLAEGFSTVRMVHGEGDDAETVLLHIGAIAGDGRQRFVQRAGDDIVYIISSFLADRLLPNVESFQPSEEPETPLAGGGAPPGMPGGGPGGPGGGQLPPEIMQQIQQQLQAQGAEGP